MAQHALKKLPVFAARFLHLFFFYKQPVYKQLALGWKIAASNFQDSTPFH